MSHFVDSEKRFVESKLEKLDYVQWDRFVERGLGVKIYGWIDRKDDYKDFVVVELNPHRRTVRGFVTSSAKCDEHISNDLGRPVENNNACKRVENYLDIENCIELGDSE